MWNNPSFFYLSILSLPEYLRMNCVADRHECDFSIFLRLLHLTFLMNGTMKSVPHLSGQTFPIQNLLKTLHISCLTSSPPNFEASFFIPLLLPNLFRLAVVLFTLYLLISFVLPSSPSIVLLFSPNTLFLQFLVNKLPFCSFHVDQLPLAPFRNVFYY